MCCTFSESLRCKTYKAVPDLQRPRLAPLSQHFCWILKERVRTGRKCAYRFCLRRELGKYLTAGSLIPSASYKRSVATAAIKGKFLGILDAVPLLLVTLEKPGHCWALIAPGVQPECQQLLRIIHPPLPAAAELRSHRGEARPGAGHPRRPRSRLTSGERAPPGAVGCRRVLCQGGRLYKQPAAARQFNPPPRTLLFGL